MVVWSMRVMVVVGVRSMGMVIMVSVRRMRVCAEQNTRSLQRRRIGERRGEARAHGGYDDYDGCEAYASLLRANHAHVA
jgi:hypothetical protein